MYGYIKDASPVGPQGSIGLSAGSNVLAQKHTAFDKIQSSCNEVHRVCSRLEDIATKLIGGWSQAFPTDGAVAPRPSGLVGDIECASDGINQCIRRMDDVLDAIERALP